MKKVSIRFQYDIFDSLKKYLLSEKDEKHAFLYCNLSENAEDIVFLPKKIIGFNDEDPNIRKSSFSFKLNKELLYQIFIDFVESQYSGLISCHSHPFENGEVWFSGIDDKNDFDKIMYFYEEIPKGKKHLNLDYHIHMISMVFGQKSIGARGVDTETKIFYPVDNIVILGQDVKNIIPSNNKKKALSEKESERLNRQGIAFGDEGKNIFSKLKIGVIGVGGTGSIIVEGLCRLGLKRIILIDDDKLELSNMNRWQGAKIDDEGNFKVNLAQRNLTEMFDDLWLEAKPISVLTNEAIQSLKTCDFLVGCVDDHSVRYFINRFSVQYLMPYIDCSSGIIIDDQQNRITKIGSRISVVIPSYTACLDCSKIEYYNREDISYTFSDSETYQNLKSSNYITTDQNIPSPAVYPLNMLSCSILLLEFMNIFIHFKPVYWNTYLNYLNFNEEKQYSHDTENHFEMSDDNCIICNDYIGAGDSESLSVFIEKERSIALPDFK